MPIVGIIAMQAWDMPIIARLPLHHHGHAAGVHHHRHHLGTVAELAHVYVIAGIFLHSMPSSIVSHCMLALIGMPIMASSGMAAFMFIGICMAFIMAVTCRRSGGKCDWGRF